MFGSGKIISCFPTVSQIQNFSKDCSSKIKHYIFKILAFALQPFSYCPKNNFKEKKLIFHYDSLRIDSLSIVPGSVAIIYKNEKLSEKHFEVDYPKAIIYVNTEELKKKIGKSDSVTVQYRTFPLNFSNRY